MNRYFLKVIFWNLTRQACTSYKVQTKMSNANLTSYALVICPLFTISYNVWNYEFSNNRTGLYFMNPKLSLTTQMVSYENCLKKNNSVFFKKRLNYVNYTNKKR